MIALIGNPNCGKSALFNKLTKSNQKVGNYSGVTVDKKIGMCKSKEIIDLPGIYSLNAYTDEEKVTVDYIKNNKIDLIINVIDINLLNRSLYLTHQLKNLNIPILMLLTKDDGFNKTKINTSLLSRIMDLDVINVSVFKNKNLDKLEKYIQKEKNINSKVNIKIEVSEDFIINTYKKIDSIVKRVTIIFKNNKISNLIDNILLNKYLSFIINIISLIVVYFLAIKLVGNFFVNIVNNFNSLILEHLKNFLINLNVSNILISLLVDGILNGVSIVLMFIPQVIIITLIFSMLEDSGYIARLALTFDRLLKKIGLSSKSFFPLLLSSSCSSIAILQTRTIKNKQEKFLACLFIPFIPCSAKMPIILLFLNKYYNNSLLVFLSFYIVMLLIIFILSFIFKKKSISYIMEIPILKLPNIKVTIKNTYEVLKSFIRRLVSVIILFSIVNWFLLSFDFNLNYNVTINESILYKTVSKLSFLTVPFLGEWSISSLISIITGLIAKEQVISTLNVVGNNLNIINAYSFVCFNLFTVPCISTLIAVKKEFGYRYLIFIILIEIIVSLIVSTLIFRSLLWIL